MKALFILLFALFVGIYAYAEYSHRQIRAVGEDPDVVHLRWATDPNPARVVQTAAFGKVFPGYRVSVEPSGADKLLVQCATGTGPDIIDVYSIQQMGGYVDAGILLDLTPYAEKDGFGPSNTYPALKDDLGVEGKQYRFPCNVWANCVIYNRELFDDHGIPYPTKGWSWADFIEAGKKFNQKGKSGKTHIPLANFYPYWMFCDLLMSHGGRFYSENGLSSRLDTPEAIAAMSLYHDLVYKHSVIPTPEIVSSLSSQGGWGSGALDWFSTDRAAMIVIGRWYLNMLVNYPDMPRKISVVELPHAEGRTTSGVCGTRAAGINARGPRREQALKFLQYLGSKEYSQIIVQDGDSLPPNPDYAKSGEALVNKTVSDPAFHQPFVDSIKVARPMDISTFINANLVERWINERVSRVDNNREIDVPAVMRDLAKEVNLKIDQNIEREKHLREKFAKVMGRPWTPDWRKSGQL